MLLLCARRPNRYLAAGLSAALLIALSRVAPVQADGDPRDALMPRKDGLSACFRRDYDAAHLKANPAQATQSILLSLKYQDGNVEGLILRLMMKRKDSPKPYFMMGGCDWAEHKTPGAQAARILGNARLARGLDCIMLESRESARESGDVIVDFSTDAKSAVAVSDEVIAAWHGLDQSEAAPDLTLGRDDVVFRLTRTDEKACRAMEQGIRF